MVWSHKLILFFLATSCPVSSAQEVKFIATRKDASGTVVPLYYQYGSISLTCRAPSGADKIMIDKLMPNKTYEQTVKENDGQSVSYSMYLNKTGIIGLYQCSAFKSGDKAADITIGYIMCNPLEVIPPKICRKGEFCLVDKTGYKCSSKLECGKQPKMVRLCKDGQEIKKANTVCNLYASISPFLTRYYTVPSDVGCRINPTFYQDGKRLDSATTTNVTSIKDIKLSAQHMLSPGQLSAECVIRTLTGNEYRYKSPKVDKKKVVNLTAEDTYHTPSELPKKGSMKCRFLYGDEAFTAMYFFLLFSGKEDPKITISQGGRSFDVTRTNAVKEELDATKPFTCSASRKGFYIRVDSAAMGPSSGQNVDKNSVDLRFNKSSNGTYICIVTVSFYEVPPNAGFKQLSREERRLSITFSKPSIEEATTKPSGPSTKTGAESSTSILPSIAKGSKAPAGNSGRAGFIAGMVMVAIVLTALVLTLAIVAIFWYRKKKKKEMTRAHPMKGARTKKKPKTTLGVSRTEFHTMQPTGAYSSLR